MKRRGNIFNRGIDVMLIVISFSTMSLHGDVPK